MQTTKSVTLSVSRLSVQAGFSAPMHSPPISQCLLQFLPPGYYHFYPSFSSLFVAFTIFLEARMNKIVSLLFYSQLLPMHRHCCAHVCVSVVHGSNRTLLVLVKHCTTELHHQPTTHFCVLILDPCCFTDFISFLETFSGVLRIFFLF